MASLLTKYLTSAVFKKFVETEHSNVDSANVIDTIKNYNRATLEYIEAAYGDGTDESVEKLSNYLNSADCTKDGLNEIKNSILKIQGKEIEKSSILKKEVEARSISDQYQNDAPQFTNFNNIAESKTQEMVDSLERKLGDLQVDVENLSTLANGIDSEKIENLEKIVDSIKLDVGDIAESASDVLEANIFNRVSIALSILALAITGIGLYKNSKNQNELNGVNDKIDQLIRENPDLNIPEDSMRSSAQGSGNLEKFKEIATKCTEMSKEGLNALAVKLHRHSDAEKEQLLPKDGKQGLHFNNPGYGNLFKSKSEDVKSVGTSDLLDRNEYEQGTLHRLKRAATEGVEKLKSGVSSMFGGANDLIKKAKLDDESSVSDALLSDTDDLQSEIDHSFTNPIHNADSERSPWPAAKGKVSLGFDDDFHPSEDQIARANISINNPFYNDVNGDQSMITPRSTLYTHDRSSTDDLIAFESDKVAQIDQNHKSKIESIAARVEQNDVPLVKEFVEAFEPQATKLDMVSSVENVGLSRGSSIMA